MTRASAQTGSLARWPDDTALSTSYPIVRDRYGELITPNMLPSIHDRWTLRKREVAQLAIGGGLITIEQALKLWRMTYEELGEWGVRTENYEAARPLPRPADPPSKFIQASRYGVQLNDTDRLILELLSNYKEKVVTPRMIASVIYANRTAAKTRTIDVFVMRLRRRLLAHQAQVAIRTVWGRGYLLYDLDSFNYIAAV
jgi:hypothetical protein